ncbi:glyoxalase family protein [Paenibacillus sp. UNC496MF]|uniref:VOC family protein n=1 Tax=Paenibacillus sp. UNC496MF TaxID=1502753 RepID=UPI0008E3AA0B|nr:VOC family protein [Paenibacillus sp. UNC496MF]SFJ35114.1 glyoxalase family protein [Paenibacillus sp. UNC496MF]
MAGTAGIHHITSFIRTPQLNVDFYSKTLGLRLLKKSINFDAPEIYHLYYGNEAGRPGTALTFFPSKDARRGSVGGGQVGYTTLAVPANALAFWEERLANLGVACRRARRFDETYLRFADPDGLHLEMVEREAGAPSKWPLGDIPFDKAIKGLGGAKLYSADPDGTQRTLRLILGLERVGREGGWVRYRTAGDFGNYIDLNASPMPWGDRGAGTVHHIAWRARNDEELRKCRERVVDHGFEATAIINRQRYNAFYYREQGGMLFEVATDAPGIVMNEPFEIHAKAPQLPSWSVVHREFIEDNLLPVKDRVLEEEKR